MGKEIRKKKKRACHGQAFAEEHGPTVLLFKIFL